MKFGLRMPSLKKSISARTKGQITRSVKRAIISFYGQKGVGTFHPKKKIYNKIYNKSTF